MKEALTLRFMTHNLRKEFAAAANYINGLDTLPDGSSFSDFAIACARRILTVESLSDDFEKERFTTGTCLLITHIMLETFARDCLGFGDGEGDDD